MKAIVTKELDVANFSQNQHHPKPSDKNAIEWVFVIDTLNFCFWTPGNSTKWQVCGETGYFALCAAINRAQRNGIDITNAKYYSKITADELSEILRGDDNETKVPMLVERVKCLNEVGKKLIEKYDGKFESCLLEADHSARRLLRIITDEFPCFRDEAEWNGIGVSFYKRAQILIGDLVSALRNTIQLSKSLCIHSFSKYSGLSMVAKEMVGLKILIILQCLPIIACLKCSYISAL